MLRNINISFQVENRLNDLASALGGGNIICWQDTDDVIATAKENVTYLRHDVDTSSLDASGVVDSYS